MWEYNHSDELYHWGIKGMKWGVRRYRNEDGTLTEAGKKRYSDEPVHEDYAKVHDNKSVKSMSDAELRARNNRLQMERQYAQMTKKESRGKKAVQAFIATGALTAGVITAIGQYKAAADKVKPVADKALAKIKDVDFDALYDKAEKVKGTAAAVVVAAGLKFGKLKT